MDLDVRFQRHILNRTLRCIIITKDTHPQIKFDVFERINTGAIQLNPQELRNGVYSGVFMDLVRTLAKNPLWTKLTGLKVDKRMRKEELILRFFAFHANLKKYKKPLITFLNDFAADQRFHNKKHHFFETLFSNTIHAIHSILGENSFRLVGIRNVKRNFNAAIYDCQMYGFGHLNQNQITDIVARKADFAKSQKDLFSDENFRRSVTFATSDESSVFYRMENYLKFLKDF